MPRLIDADALEKKIVKRGAYKIRTDDVIALIADAPTVDAVPVRCKDCKYDGRCMFQSFVIDNSRDEVPYDKNTFYCADGERKDGEHE